MYRFIYRYMFIYMYFFSFFLSYYCMSFVIKTISLHTLAPPGGLHTAAACIRIVSVQRTTEV